MSLITFNIFFIISAVILHLIFKPILKKKYPLKILGTFLLSIIVMLIFDLIPLTCWIIIKIHSLL